MLIYTNDLTPLAILLLTFYINIKETQSIGCFVCHSFNNSNPECDDPFNTTMLNTSDYFIRSKYYQSQCWGYRKDRAGLFPADHCIKIQGEVENMSNLTIRTCSLDSGTLTADTEIVRISHCGHFQYNNVYYKGCVQSCGIDGCNSAAYFKLEWSMFITVMVALLYRAFA